MSEQRNNAVAGTGVLGVALACGTGLWLSAMPAVTALSGALVVFAVGFWALRLLPEALTGLIFLVGVVVLTPIAPGTAFSGFATSAFWLIFAGMVLSACATRTGLSAWLADRILNRDTAVSGYARLTAAVVVFAAGLALVLPATLGRVALLVPLVAALAERLGYASHGPGRTGLILAAAIGTYVVPTTFLPANLPNIVLAGSLESIYAITPTFGEYLLLHFPVIGLIKGAALILIVTRLYNETPGRPEPAPEADKGLQGPARRLGVVLCITLALWASDTLHGYSAAWVGMTAAIVCLLPATRILGFDEVPFASIFPALLYLGAVLGLGAVMVESGAGAALSRALLAVLPLEGTSDAMVLAMMTLTAIVTSLAATTPGAPAITAPLFGDFAEMTGWSVEAVGMAQVLGYATPLLPYTLPPLILAVTMGRVPLREATRVLLLLAVTTTPVVLPAAYLWWGVLGWF